MSCPVERVTGYVDGALEPPEREEIETHLGSCESCRAQVESEREVRGRLLSLLHPPMPASVEEHVRARLWARPRVRFARILLPLAAAAAIAVVWARQQPRFVAWEMARDHAHCFDKPALPAQVWVEDAETILRWFEKQGTAMPVIPDRAGGYAIVGGRYCPFPDLTRAAHLYYKREDKRSVSVFVVNRRLSGADPSLLVSGGNVVHIGRVGHLTVGLVGEEKEDVEAFAETFRTSVASR